MSEIKINESVKQLELILKKRKNRFEEILQNNADRFIQLFLNYSVKNPLVLQCEKVSLISAVLDIARIGLEIGFGQVDIVPFYDSKKKIYMPQIIIGYQGYLELLYRSGFIKTCYANIVYENDEFECSYGSAGRLYHKPNYTNRGEIIGAYAYAETNSEGKVYVFLTTDEIEKIRKQSKQADGFAWSNGYEAMAKKTALRQLVKWLPKFSIIINKAIQIDEASEWGKIKVNKDELTIEPSYEKKKEVDIQKAKEVIKDKLFEDEKWKQKN